MIERLEDAPDGVIGFRLTGKLTRDEYHELLAPVNETLDRNEHLVVAVVAELEELLNDVALTDRELFETDELPDAVIDVHDEITDFEVAEIGQVESPPLLDGRNMVMVLAPTKNAGVKRDAEDENTQRSEEAVQGDGGGEDLAPARQPDLSAGPPREEEAGEAEASAAGQAGRT